MRKDCIDVSLFFSFVPKTKSIRMFVVRCVWNSGIRWYLFFHFMIYYYFWWVWQAYNEDDISNLGNLLYCDCEASCKVKIKFWTNWAFSTLYSYTVFAFKITSTQLVLSNYPKYERSNIKCKKGWTVYGQRSQCTWRQCCFMSFKLATQFHVVRFP